MRWTFERRLFSLVVVALAGLASVGWMSSRSLDRMDGQLNDLVDNQALLAAQQHADMMHDALRADVVSVMLDEDPVKQEQAAADAADHAQTATSDMQTGGAVIERMGLDSNDPVASAFSDASAAMNAYSQRAVSLVELARHDGIGAQEQLPDFLDTFAGVESQMGRLTTIIEDRALDAQHTAKSVTGSGATRIRLLAVTALVLLIGLVLATRKSVRSMLNARDLAEVEATRISELVRHDAERQHFKNSVNDALDMIDNEADLYAVVRRSLAATTAERPAELLLADNSRAHLRLAVEHPESGGPGCPVQSPWDCVAVRRGQTISFESSERLNVCPKLRNRPGGACSAVCVPVTFMGGALGVLHATGPDGVPFDANEIERLTVLATEAGTRIGTVRAFAKTQLQAATDPLTGLPNRRNLEEQVSALVAENVTFAVAIADLDHFKQINDRHGHDAGDRALRLFARVLRASLRTNDIAARYGGEEFAIILPNCSTEDAVATLERMREDLALALLDGRCPAFTASFGLAWSLIGEPFDEIVVKADEALFAAKEAGRNRVVIAGQMASTPGSRGDHSKF
ncbi:MAG: hypothetical protein JWN99_159 [Ilumatobacteraceae bacterium]|nr:hypothetical protein [Ilumatobacteraceae bacterium]